MSAGLQIASTVHDCWNRIGIGGDRSCPELETHVHCRSCPVFAAAAQSFFSRPAPQGYLASCTELLAQEKEAVQGDAQSVLLFRLHGEWLALATQALAEVTLPCPVHRVPHISNDVFSGLVNVRGQLLLCASLHNLLSVNPPGQAARSGELQTAARTAKPRLVVIGSETERWAFPAEEVRGVQRVWRTQLRAVPSTHSKIAHTYSRAVFAWDDHTVGLLDEHRVLSALRSLGK
jgi:chemotaxis-related protein WspD